MERFLGKVRLIEGCAENGTSVHLLKPVTRSSPSEQLARMEEVKVELARSNSLIAYICTILRINVPNPAGLETRTDEKSMGILNTKKYC